MTTQQEDDLGFPVELGDVRRVVSLVPSLTEAIATSAADLLVGATDWCTHPADLDVARVRGTKNPDRAAIAALKPDLVIANQEENRELDVARLRAAGIAVWVTAIESVEQSLASMRRLFSGALRRDVPDWLVDAEREWTQPAPTPALRAAVAIWRDPWMVVGPRTFTGDLLRRLGLVNVFDDGAERYPRATPDEIVAREPDLVLLPDEPYVFTADDGPEAFPHTRTVLVEGRLLTWYGPSLAHARADLLTALRS